MVMVARYLNGTPITKNYEYAQKSPLKLIKGLFEKNSPKLSATTKHHESKS